ncbi:hypothetical protein [Escherichia coli]|uniref:hypothetical protein n=1 Tax=Escherichia coli TaxID=562 RepID=UPI00192D01A5|nr:hypothetical protein [Escherichia coli]
MKPTYEELEQQLAESHRALRAETTAHDHVKMHLEKMAAENAALKKFCKDAAFDADYEAELGMERGGFSDALNDIETTATDAFLAEVKTEARKEGAYFVANRMLAGNSPVIPDGWKLVPIDPTKDMLRAGQSVVGFWLNTVHCYSKMLAAAPAAPKQEVTQALAKGMERYGDAMQKLADSGD